MTRERTKIFYVKCLKINIINDGNLNKGMKRRPRAQHGMFWIRMTKGMREGHLQVLLSISPE